VTSLKIVELVLIKEGLSEMSGFFLAHPARFVLDFHEFRPSGGGDEFFVAPLLKKPLNREVSNHFTIDQCNL